MDPELLDLLVCPACKSKLHYDTWLICSECKKKYEVRDGVPLLLIEKAKDA